MTLGAFTVSLDCEGLWGMADQQRVISDGTICDASLQQAYQFIARVLETHEIRATCAFVSAFAAGPAVLREHLGVLEQLASYYPMWFANILTAMRRADYDGWFGDALYTALRAKGHEMAWHGGTHLSLSETTSPAAIALELRLTAYLLREIGDQPTTVVFPRNQVGHLPVLQRAGFRAYRDGRPRGALAKLSNLASEWNIRDSHVDATPYLTGDWQVSPPGFFLNWPSGVRSLVPSQVTVSRWKSLLHHAAERRGYLHMWFHPHNLITAPKMGIVFEQIISEVGRLVRSGDLVSLPMNEANAYFGLTQQSDAHSASGTPINPLT